MDRNIVNRDERAALAAVVKRFLNDEIKAFEFDDELELFRGSGDSAVRHVACTMYYFYDDFRDHQVVLSKQGWNYIQRLLLLLNSDATVVDRPRPGVGLTRLLAGGFLMVGAAVAWLTGMSWPYLAYAAPMGLASMVVTAWRRQLERAQPRSPYYDVATPFASIADLAQVLRASAFRKERYPRRLESRRIRSRSEEVLNYVLRYPIALCYSLAARWIAGPLVLLIQCLAPCQEPDWSEVVLAVPGRSVTPRSF